MQIRWAYVSKYSGYVVKTSTEGALLQAGPSVSLGKLELPSPGAILSSNLKNLLQEAPSGPPHCTFQSTVLWFCSRTF